MDQLSGWDIGVIVAYFLIIIAISIYVRFSFLIQINNSFKLFYFFQKSSITHKRNTVDSYFLAGRKMTWIFVRKYLMTYSD